MKSTPAMHSKSSPSNDLEPSTYEPGYLSLHRKGELKARGEELWEMMRDCSLCPRSCGTNRLEKDRGFCGSNDNLEISSTIHTMEKRSLYEAMQAQVRSS